MVHSGTQPFLIAISLSAMLTFFSYPWPEPQVAEVAVVPGVPELSGVPAAAAAPVVVPPGCDTTAAVPVGSGRFLTMGSA